MEYAGGKVDNDTESPYQTAYAELVEELGTDILDVDWMERVQPFISEAPSGKTIWVFRYTLNEREYARLCRINFAEWNVDEYRDLSHLTSRQSSQRTRKSLAKAFLVQTESMLDLLKAFRATGKTMKDAKDLRQTVQLTCTNVADTNDICKFGLRAFNTILFEKMNI